MATWPSGLYGCILKDGFQETTPDNVIRSPMDVGPAKIRQRSTSDVRSITLTLFLDKDQLALLEDFYVITTKYGSLQFGMFRPRYRHDAISGQYRFAGAPMYSNFDQGWRVAMKLEELP